MFSDLNTILYRITLGSCLIRLHVKQNYIRPLHLVLLLTCSTEGEARS